jgi:D-3-phosphoglycerate dehydrogenase/C-terminal binding protein
LGKIDSADAVMMYHSCQVTRETIKRLTNCKLIVRCGVGIDNVDWKFARECAIAVANVPDYGTEEVADSAIALTLTLTRGVSLLNSRLRRGIEPWSHIQAAPLHRLRGKVYGIIGMGSIGTASALRAKALGMDVVFFDPYKPAGYDKALGIRMAHSLEELLRQTHVLTLHCPLNEETHHIINRETLALLPEGSFLVNTGRGGCVDNSAIPEAIVSGRLAGAGIDVLPIEPPAADDPLIVAWRDPHHPCHDRVVINPHSAFYSVQGLQEMRTKGAFACKQALLGNRIPNVVN